MNRRIVVSGYGARLQSIAIAGLLLLAPPAAMTAKGQPPGGKFDRAVHRFATQGERGHQEQVVIRTGSGRGSSLLGEARAQGYRIQQAGDDPDLLAVSGTREDV